MGLGCDGMGLDGIRVFGGIEHLTVLKMAKVGKTLQNFAKVGKSWLKLAKVGKS